MLEPELFADVEDSTREVFGREADALERAGFHEPDTTPEPLEHKASVAYDKPEVLLSPVDEAARLGINIEQ